MCAYVESCFDNERDSFIMEYLFIYLLQLTETLRDIAWVWLLAVPIIWFFGSFLLLDCDIAQELIIKNAKKFLAIWLGIPLLIFILPAKQTLLLMGGTYLGKQAVNQVVTSQKLEKVNTIIDLQLDKYLKELKEVTK